MGKKDLLEEVPSFIGVLRAEGVVPEDVTEHYVSWGSVQHGEGGDSLEGTVLLTSDRWLHIYDVRRSGSMEEATHRAIPRSAVKRISRTWRGSRGFDESAGTDTAEESSVVIELDGHKDIELPLRDTDYNAPYKAWRRTQAFSVALLNAPS